MARFMDDSECGKAPIGLNNYNRVCFASQKEAEKILSKKHLLPGQITFAYYYDSDTEYGVNVMAAVGTLNGVGDNHIFISYDTVNQLFSSIDDSFDDIDTSLLYIKKNIINKIDDVQKDVVLKVDSINNRITEMDASHIAYVNSKLDTSFIDKFIEDVSNRIAEYEKEASDIIDGSIKNYINEKIQELQQDINTKTTDVAQKYNNLKYSIAEINSNIVNIDNNHTQTELDLQHLIKNTKNEITNFVNDSDASIIKYINNRTQLIQKEIEVQISALEHDAKTQSIKLNTTVEEYQHNVQNDIAVFNSSIRTLVKSKLATLKTDLDTNISDLKTYVTANDSSLLSYIKSLNTQQRTYINQHDSEIKSWINTANSSLFNIVRATDSKLKDDIDAIDSRHKALYKTIESRLDNLIYDVSTDLSIKINNYNIGVQSFVKTEINKLSTKYSEDNASLINFVNIKTYETINEARKLNNEIREEVKKTEQHLDDRINDFEENTSAEFYNYVNNEFKTIIDSEIQYVDDKVNDVSVRLNILNSSLKDYIDKQDILYDSSISNKLNNTDSSVTNIKNILTTLLGDTSKVSNINQYISTYINEHFDWIDLGE